MFYSCFAGQGFDLIPEESSSRGRADLALRFDGTVYLFAFKTVETAPTGAALAQLKAKNYADKYRHGGEPVSLVGVEFSRTERTIAAVEGERLPASP